jgi:hypothetical protein
MATIETMGGEEVRVCDSGAEALRLTVTDPRFGRIATVRLDHVQAARLASALDQRLIAAAGGSPVAPE